MKKKILIVEDDAKIRELVQINLKADGYQTITAIDGKGALAIAQIDKPDLILLDLGLPVLNGLEVANILKRDLKTRYIPIIALTAYAQQKDKLKGFSYGFDDYITKPFDPLEMIARVKAVLKRASKSQLLDKTTGLPKEAVLEEDIERKIIKDPSTCILFIRLIEKDGVLETEIKEHYMLISNILYSSIDNEKELAFFISTGNFGVLTTSARANDIGYELIKKTEKYKNRFLINDGSPPKVIDIYKRNSLSKSSFKLIVVKTYTNKNKRYFECKKTAENIFHRASQRSGDMLINEKDFIGIATS